MWWSKNKRSTKKFDGTSSPPPIIKNLKNIGERDGMEFHHFNSELDKPIKLGKPGLRIVTPEEWYATGVEDEEISDYPEIIKIERVGVIGDMAIDYFKVRLTKPIPPAKKGFEIITPPQGMFD